MTSNDKFQAEFLRIQAQFLKNLSVLLPEIKLFAEKLLSDSASSEDIKDYINKFHKLAGSGKTFGFSQISKVAAQIEDALFDIQNPDNRKKKGKLISETEKFIRAFLIIAEKALADSSKLPEIPDAIETGQVEKLYNILSVDDDELIRNLLEHGLKSAGCNVKSLDSGERVLELLKTERPDLIILDINMPGMNGMQVLRRLKSDQRYQDIPVIMLTKQNAEKDVIEGISSGALDYIIKPFKFEQLVNRVLTILKVKNIKLLIADDDSIIVDLLSSKFYKKGYTVLKCYDGNTALKRIKEEKPDLAILDIMMPGLDGLTALKQVKDIPEIANIPIIIITAKTQQDNIIKSFENGAYDYITKPFNLDDVAAKVTATLRKHKLL